MFARSLPEHGLVWAAISARGPVAHGQSTLTGRSNRPTGRSNRSMSRSNRPIGRLNRPTGRAQGVFLPICQRVLMASIYRANYAVQNLDDGREHTWEERTLMKIENIDEKREPRLMVWACTIRRNGWRQGEGKRLNCNQRGIFSKREGRERW